jgi:hypothetical protein
MNNDQHCEAEVRAGLARFLSVALVHFRGDAEAVGLTATVKALDEAVSALDVDVPRATAN